MCVIILKPAGSVICPNILKTAYENNADGFGLMYAQNGRVQFTKGMMDFNEIMRTWSQFKRRTVAAHFRFATVGNKVNDNVHPFRILSLDEDGIDLYMMHNGTFRDFSAKDGMSDTVQFAEMMTKAMRQKGFGILKDPEKRKKMGEVVGKHNKILFMNGLGETFLINEGEGLYTGNIWYSNTYSLQSGYRRAKLAANASEYDHYFSGAGSKNTSGTGSHQVGDTSKALTVVQGGSSARTGGKRYSDWWKQYNTNGNRRGTEAGPDTIPFDV